jgi:hypothetical protein
LYPFCPVSFRQRHLAGIIKSKNGKKVTVNIGKGLIGVLCVSILESNGIQGGFGCAHCSLNALPMIRYLQISFRIKCSMFNGIGEFFFRRKNREKATAENIRCAFLLVPPRPKAARSKEFFEDGQGRGF